MRIETTGLLYPAPLGAPLTPQTPPPSTDGPAAMDGDIRPAVDALPLRGRREYAQLCLLRDDFAACLAVVNGMELGVFIRRARLFAFYGQRAPRLEVRPLWLDGSFGPLAAAVGYGLAVWYGFRNLDGMSGDISGFALTIGELCGCGAAILWR